MRCSLYFVPLIAIVCPALLPPWYRATTSAFSAKKSVIFPFPSSPHCVPTTTTDDKEITPSFVFPVRILCIHFSAACLSYQFKTVSVNESRTIVVRIPRFVRLSWKHHFLRCVSEDERHACGLWKTCLSSPFPSLCWFTCDMGVHYKNYEGTASSRYDRSRLTNLL